MDQPDEGLASVTADGLYSRCPCQCTVTSQLFLPGFFPVAPMSLASRFCALAAAESGDLAASCRGSRSAWRCPPSLPSLARHCLAPKDQIESLGRRTPRLERQVSVGRRPDAGSLGLAAVVAAVCRVSQRMYPAGDTPTDSKVTRCSATSPRHQVQSGATGRARDATRQRATTPPQQPQFPAKRGISASARRYTEDRCDRRAMSS